MSVKERLSGLLPGVYVLIMFFAISSWIDINGVWVELPLLVNKLPESWSLASYLSIITQIANIGPIIYTIANRTSPDKVTEWKVIYVIISIGAVSCFLLAFLWERTAVIGGEPHSIGLFALTGCLALVDCTSSVAYLPYMARFKEGYITAFYIGEGLSGLLPSLMGLIQGVGGEPTCVNETTAGNMTNDTGYSIYPVYPPPRFDVQAFFFFLFAMICLSALCFSLLHFLPYVKTAHLVSTASYELQSDTSQNGSTAPEVIWFSPDPHQNQVIESNGTGFVSEKSTLEYQSAEEKDGVVLDTQVINEKGIKQKHKPDKNPNKDQHKYKIHLSTAQFVFVLVMAAWTSGVLLGVLTSVSSYAAMPYGVLAYSLAVRLGVLMDPLMGFLSLMVRIRSLMAVGFLVAVGTGLAGVELYLAAMSPFPPFKGEAAGIAFVVIVHVLSSACLLLVKMTCNSILLDSKGHIGLLWAGGFTQIGAAVGSIIIFVVINVLEVFQEEYACSSYEQ